MCYVLVHFIVRYYFRLVVSLLYVTWPAHKNTDCIPLCCESVKMPSAFTKTLRGLAVYQADNTFGHSETEEGITIPFSRAKSFCTITHAPRASLHRRVGRCFTFCPTLSELYIELKSRPMHGYSVANM